MPRGIYSNVFCNGEKTKKFKPTEHQVNVLNQYMNKKYKGMLFYHTLGSGKTCSSILVMDEMLRKKIVKHVYVLTPGSLRSNWLTEYCTLCGWSEKALYKYVTFITYNYGIPDMPDLTNSLVIIDEVHNLVNGFHNQSKTMTRIYNTIVDADCHVLALSGTPLKSKIPNMFYISRLLKPSGGVPSDIYKQYKSKGLEQQLYKVVKYKSDEKDIHLGTSDVWKYGIKIIDEKLFRQLFSGIISYHSSDSKEVPEVIQMPAIKTFMTPLQEEAYWTVDKFEKSINEPSEELKRKNIQKYNDNKKLYIMAVLHIFTRRVSNVFYPETDKELPDKLEENGGWISDENLQNQSLLKIYSKKIVALLLNITKNYKHKHVIHTFFKTKSGAYLVKALMKKCGISCEIYSGDQNDTHRKNLLKRFNDPSNRYGKNIKVLIITDAGAEGISLMEVQHLHILESSRSINETNQIIGRIARFRSHSSLPEKMRWVKVWRYWTVSKYPPKHNITFNLMVGDYTIDQKLYILSKKKNDILESFLERIKQISVT